MAGEWSLDDTKSSGGNWIRLKKDGDKVLGMFVIDESDKDLGAVIYPEHYIDGGYHPCWRVPGEKENTCPYCKRDKPSWRMRMTMYDVLEGEKKMIDGMPAMWLEDVKEAVEGEDWRTVIFRITRKGDKGKSVRRTIKRMPDAPEENVLAAMAEIEPFTAAELLEDQMRKLENERAGTMVAAVFDGEGQPPIDDDDLPF